MRILNLFAGVGGNRELWKGHHITAVENNEYIASKYEELWPDDNVFVEDAHEFLLNHHHEFDFIWSSPPCTTHSRARFAGYGVEKPVYPDMTLYQQIVFLRTHFKGKFAVENVIPYYSPLIPAQHIGRHLFWCNFRVGTFEPDHDEIQDLAGNTLSHQIERNKTNPLIGEYILNCAMNIITKTNVNQMNLYDH